MVPIYCLAAVINTRHKPSPNSIQTMASPARHSGIAVATAEPTVNESDKCDEADTAALALFSVDYERTMTSRMSQ